MLNLITRISFFFLKVILYTLCGISIISIFFLPNYVKSLPDLSSWHIQDFESEFHQELEVKTFDAYLELEKKLFAELDKEIVNNLSSSDKTKVNRFHRKSIAYPGADGINWNHSFILPSFAAERSILLLHGLSDSPYSLHSIGQHLNKNGALVLGLRLPGHGTAPSGLLDATWEDMAAAVKLAMQYLQIENPGKPVYIIGYSTGAALALNYSLLSLSDSHLKRPDGLVFISPAIGVSKFAALANIKEKLSHFPGLEKIAWTDILPEYNPYKYNSFTANAGNQVYQLTRKIQQDFATSKKDGRLNHLPKILTFQSIVDATVSATAVVNNLFHKLSKPGNEIIIFDINRYADLQPLILKDPVPAVHQLLETINPNFSVSFVTNMDHGSNVFLHRKKEAQSAIEKTPLNISWPDGLYSLSHVALPFSENDPLYGRRDAASDKLNLGDIPLRGERGVLAISANEIIRLKWNPFYSFMEEKIDEFIFEKKSKQPID